MNFKGVDNPEVYVIDYDSHPEDIESGYPLSGQRGSLVCSLLGSMSLLGETRFSCWKGQGPDVVKEDIIRCNPKIIVGFGGDLMEIFTHSGRRITDMSGKVVDISINGQEFKYLIVMSPSYVLNRPEDSSLVLRFSQDLYKAFQVVNGEYRDILKEKEILSAHSFDEFREIYETRFLDDRRIAYDIETNARPIFTEGGKIVGFSIGNKKSGVYVSISALDFEMPKEEEDRVWDFLINEVFLKKDKLIIHNTMYERPYTLFCKGYEIPYEKAEDTLVMARLLKGPKETAGLKFQAQKMLQYPDWEVGLGSYISGFRGVVERIGFGPKKFSGLWSEIYNNSLGIFSLTETESFDNLSDVDKEEISEIIDNLKNPLIDLYDEDEIENLGKLITDKVVFVYDQGGVVDSTIPYNYIPDRLLSKYGAIDSISTFDLCEYYEDIMDKESTDTVDLHKGYRNWREHMYVAYIMERNGMFWNEDLVKQDEEFLVNQATRCLKSMVLSPAFKQMVMETCEWKYKPVILSDYLPSIPQSQGFEINYDRFTGKYILKYQGKRCAKNRITEIVIPDIYKDQYSQIVYDMFKEEVSKAESYEDLKDIYNPSSTSHSDIPRRILITEDLQMGGRITGLHTLAVSPEFEGLIDSLPQIDSKFLKIANILCDAKGLKSQYGDSWAEKRKEFYKGFCTLWRTYRGNVRTPEIRKILDDPCPVVIDSFDDGGVISIYDNLVVTGMDQDDPKTWTPQFEWMVNFRLFKKSNKLISSYINGSVGRGSVVVVDREPLERGDKCVTRKRKYTPKIDDKEAYVLATKWSPNTAETGRWRSAIHCLKGDVKVKLADGRDLEVSKMLEEFEEGKDLFVYSLSDYTSDSRFLIDKISRIYVSGTSKKMIKVTLDNGESFEVTPNHKMISRQGEKKPITEFEVGDSLYPSYFEEDDKGYLMIYNPNQQDFSYCHYLADEYNEYHGLLRDMSSDIFGRNGSWVRHHEDFNKKNNSPKNVQRYGFVSHRNLHSRSSEGHKSQWKTIKSNRESCEEYNDLFVSHRRPSGLASMEKSWSDEKFREGHAIRNKVRGFDASVGLLVVAVKNGLKLSEICCEVYEDLRQSTGSSKGGYFKWDTLLSYVDRDILVNLVCQRAKNNHKISKIEEVVYDEPIPVYSISVNESHSNYALSCGVVSGNTIPWGSQVKKYYTSRFPGGTTLCPDYSQMEVRTLAAISKDENMLELFHSGKDFHSQTAAAVWQKPVEEVTTAERRFSKTATFSLLYGAMEESFARNYCNGDMAMAEKIYGGFFKAYPRVKEWVEARHQEVQKDHRVSLELSGRFIPIVPDGTGVGALNSMLRKSQNYPIQAQSADLTGCVIFDIQKYIEENNMKSLLIQYVHDSIEVDVYPYDLIQLVDKLKFILNDSPMRRMGLPSKADVALGKSLGHEIEMKSIEYNEDFTDGVLVLEGYKDEIYETIENWKIAYKTVEVLEEDWEEQFVSMSDLFILRKAYTPTLGTLRHTGKCKVHINYYK